MKLIPPLAYPNVADKLGAIAVPLPMIEMYSALAQGLTEGVFSPNTYLRSIPGDMTNKLNFAEVTYFSYNLHLTSPPLVFYAIRQSSWDSLSPEVQKVFNDSIPWINNEFDNLLLKEAQDSINFAKAKGHEFFELPKREMDKFYSLMEELALEKAAALDALGLPGTKIFKEVRQLIIKYAN
jgi:TRAP-type C4-dicarboxylate transport system substrate-binding protein